MADKIINVKNVVVAIGTIEKPNKQTYKIPSVIKNRYATRLIVIKTKVLMVGGGDSAVRYIVDLCVKMMQLFAIVSYVQG